MPEPTPVDSRYQIAREMQDEHSEGGKDPDPDTVRWALNMEEMARTVDSIKTPENQARITALISEIAKSVPFPKSQNDTARLTLERMIAQALDTAFPPTTTEST
ncbi:hypothetical protein KBD71_03235 [Candidatus Woesebacteria bacterium]|nr:hypothetical protein [Candidatus Woesebacteria bacterium]